MGRLFLCKAALQDITNITVDGCKKALSEKLNSIEDSCEEIASPLVFKLFDLRVNEDLN
jgi:hypothetical protein